MLRTASECRMAHHDPPSITSPAMLRFSRSALLALLLPLTGASTIAAQSAPHYHVVKRVVIGHVAADYLNIDPVCRRLYGLGDKVFDVDRDTVIGSVTDCGGGYVLAPDQNRGVARNGVVFDLKTLAATGRLDDMKADGNLCDPGTPRRCALAD